ncbi:hypothetical protein [Roseomonas fluvialis]|uniref:hypothetical protein n=1 Tax=Roseomonas fluvialis TaxID=1750527 RepID=UPI001FCC52AA|nr:hypothetical protein [Roseomonas fluvialis]
MTGTLQEEESACRLRPAALVHCHYSTARIVLRQGRNALGSSLQVLAAQHAAAWCTGFFSRGAGAEAARAGAWRLAAASTFGLVSWSRCVCSVAAPGAQCSCSA